MADFTGGDADDVFNAPATSATTGAAVTTVNSGDAINGGAGNDTLNITATATNNNSLTGLTATSIETVNISGTNNLGASSPALAAAQDAKTVTAAALATAIAASNIATAQSAAASAVEVAVDTLGGLTAETDTLNTTGAVEAAVAQAATATAASAASLSAAARYFDAQTLVATQEFLAAKAVAALSAGDFTAAKTTAPTAVPNGAIFTLTQYNAVITASADLAAAATTRNAKDVALINAIKAVADVTSSQFGTTIKTFGLSDYKAVAAATLVAKDGTIVTTADAAIARNAALDTAWNSVNVLAASTNSTVLVAAQLKAAADHVAGLTVAADVSALATATVTELNGAASGAGAVGAFTRLNTTNFTADQLSAAAKAAVVGYDSATLTGQGILDRADELAAAANAVVGVAGDFSIAQLNAAAAAALVDANGATLRTAGDDSVNIETRTDALATAAGTAASTAATAVTTATASDTAAANAVTVALASVGATSVSAAQFADATAITLSGASSKANVTGVAATQTIGFSSVSSMDNAVTFGATVAAGSLAVSGSTGTLTVTGATMAALNISGTGSTALTLVDNGQAVSSTGADTIKTLNLSTSGGTNVTTSGLSELTTVSQTGAGAVTATLGTKVASVTTGAGADLLSVSTTTAVDNPGTTINETVNASVNSGAGADRLIIATTGAGTTSVTSGAGNDTIYLTANLSGSSTISTGDDNDTIRAGTIASLQTTKIDGGLGTDTLVTSTTTFTGSDYTVLGANVVGVENLTLTGRVAALDASKTAFTTFTFLGKATTDVNTITEVSTAQNVVMARTAAVTATTGYSATGISAANASHLSVSAKGYVADSDLTAAGKQTVWGEDLRVTLTNTEAATSLLANGNKVTVAVAALAQSGVDGATTGDVTGISTTATLTGDVRSADVTLTSVRGTGSVTAPYGLGDEQLAGFSATVATNNLQNMTSVKVSGAGSVVIDAGTLAALPTTNVPENAKLTLIDLSGMTAFANQNSLGQEIGAGANNSGTVGGFNNLSTSTVTLNGNIAETVILGGARDTVVTASKVAAMDTITGFQLSASATDPLVVDATRSDVLKIGSAFTGVKMTTTASSLSAAVLEAANLSVAGVAKNDVVFNFGGDTYVFQDVGNNGLDDNDVLVKLSGTLNLDLLLQSGVIIA